MHVPVVQVGVVRMRVRQRLVPVRMHVRLVAVPGEGMLVPVVFVVHVSVIVRHRFVRVFVHVALGEVQPHTEGHQSARDPEERRRAGSGRARRRRTARPKSTRRCARYPVRAVQR